MGFIATINYIKKFCNFNGMYVSFYILCHQFLHCQYISRITVIMSIQLVDQFYYNTICNFPKEKYVIWLTLSK